MEKTIIDGETLYVGNLKSTDGYHYSDNGVGDILHLDALADALKPVVKMGKLVKKGLQEMQPDEVELEMQLQLAVSDNVPVFAIVNAGAEAHLSLKFVWKKEEINSSF